MNKKRLEEIAKIVEKILRNEELARRDDCYLILRVIEYLYPGETGKTFANVMLNAKEKNISFESITRARRKIQGEFPELKDRETSNSRNIEQNEYREYARE